MGISQPPCFPRSLAQIPCTAKVPVTKLTKVDGTGLASDEVLTLVSDLVAVTVRPSRRREGSVRTSASSWLMVSSAPSRTPGLEKELHWAPTSGT